MLLCVSSYFMSVLLPRGEIKFTIIMSSTNRKVYCKHRHSQQHSFQILAHKKQEPAYQRCAACACISWSYNGDVTWLTCLRSLSACIINSSCRRLTSSSRLRDVSSSVTSSLQLASSADNSAFSYEQRRQLTSAQRPLSDYTRIGGV